MSSPICAVGGCSRPVHAYEWCKAHYQRHRVRRDVRPNIPIGDRASDGLPGNPWAGHTPCPTCHTTRWTMPRDGGWSDTGWVCVHPDHPTVFFIVEAEPSS